MDPFRHVHGDRVRLVGHRENPDVLPTLTQEDLRLAVRAVLVHTAQRWPSGLYCSSDKSPFPCRLRRWGERALLSAGWQSEDIAAMVAQADEAAPPWLAAAGD